MLRKSLFIGLLVAFHFISPVIALAETSPSACASTRDETLAWLKSVGVDTDDLLTSKTFRAPWSVKLSDGDFARLCALPELERIYVSSQALTDEALRTLPAFRALKALDLMGNAIKGWGLFFANASGSLETLRIGSDTFDERYLFFISGLSSLRALSITYSHLSDDCLVALFFLTHLETLVLSNNDIVGSGLVFLPQSLTRLMLGWNALSDQALDHLAGLTRLQELDLNNSPGLTGATLPSLARLQALTRLDLDETNVSDEDPRAFAALGQLSSLQELRLYRTKITGKALGALAPLSKLEQIYLGFSEVNDEGIAQLGRLRALPIAGLDLRGGKFSDDSLAALVDFSALKHLSLSSNDKLTVLTLSYIGEIASLRSVQVGKTSIKADAPEVAALRDRRPELQIIFAAF